MIAGPICGRELNTAMMPVEFRWGRVVCGRPAGHPGRCRSERSVRVQRAWHAARKQAGNPNG